jgi:hypothetical protein
MAMKKANPMVAKRAADRKEFVSKKTAEKGITPAQARQRFFVQTRMAEMKAKGKTVTPEMRKQLQQKFQSGDVARKGFAAPKKKAASSMSSTSSTAKAMPAKASSRKATSQMKGLGDYKKAKPGSSAAGKGKSASQDINKRNVTPDYNNK